MKLIKEKTIKVNGADVTVRTMTGSAHYDATELKRDLIIALGKEDPDNEGFVKVSERMNSKLLRYVLLILASSCGDKSLGFALPSPEASTDDLVAGFHAVESQVSGDDYRLWFEEVESINTPPQHDGESPDSIEKK